MLTLTFVLASVNFVSITIETAANDSLFKRCI